MESPILSIAVLYNKMTLKKRSINRGSSPIFLPLNKRIVNFWPVVFNLCLVKKVFEKWISMTVFLGHIFKWLNEILRKFTKHKIWYNYGTKVTFWNASIVISLSVIDHHWLAFIGFASACVFADSVPDNAMCRNINF